MPTETEQKQIEMFGCTTAEIDTQVATNIAPASILAVSILSDAQELIANGSADAREDARQRINIAKYIITKKIAGAKP